MVNPLESVRVGKNLVERPALNGDHNFLQKIHEHQFDAQDKALATSGVVTEGDREFMLGLVMGKQSNLI